MPRRSLFGNDNVGADDADVWGPLVTAGLLRAAQGCASTHPRHAARARRAPPRTSTPVLFAHVPPCSIVPETPLPLFQGLAARALIAPCPILGPIPYPGPGRREVSAIDDGTRRDVGRARQGRPRPAPAWRLPERHITRPAGQKRLGFRRFSSGQPTDCRGVLHGHFAGNYALFFFLIPSRPSPIPFHSFPLMRFARREQISLLWCVFAAAFDASARER